MNRFTVLRQAYRGSRSRHGRGAREVAVRANRRIRVKPLKVYRTAADFIMGHESTHMSSHYRETISDARLKAVTDHVRHWLFGQAPRDKTEPDNSFPGPNPPHHREDPEDAGVPA